jgi:CRP/FNR family transcriptional regulator
VSEASPKPVVDLHQVKHRCASCSLAELCLPVGLNREDVAKLELLIEPHSTLHADDHLFRVGDAFRAIFAVRSGYLKTYLVDDGGREQVLGFHLPGELVGLDAIYPERHQCNAVALDTASVCELPFHSIEALSLSVPSLQRSMFRLMSKELGESHALAGDLSAEERLAAFLLSLANRLKARGYSETRLTLAMPRRDIANFLALATETVSRVFTRFEKEGLIHVDRRDVTLLDLDRLHALCRHGASSARA